MIPNNVVLQMVTGGREMNEYHRVLLPKLLPIILMSPAHPHKAFSANSQRWLGRKITDSACWH